MGLAIVSFIQAQPFGSPPPLTNSDTVDRVQQLNHIIPVRFAKREALRMAVRINDQMAFQAFNPVFPGETDLIVRPLLDLITLAS